MKTKSVLLVLTLFAICAALFVKDEHTSFLWAAGDFYFPKDSTSPTGAYKDFSSEGLTSYDYTPLRGFEGVTIEAWVKCPVAMGSDEGYNPIVSAEEDHTFYLGYRGQEVVLGTTRGGWGRSTAFNFADNKWHYIAASCTLSGGTQMSPTYSVKFYIDGKPAGTGRSGFYKQYPAPKRPIVVGGWNQQLSSTFQGKMAEVRESLIARSAVEIEAMWNQYMQKMSWEIIPEANSFCIQSLQNPVSFGTSVRYFVPFGARVSITVYNVQGAVVTKLVDKYTLFGTHSVFWNSVGVSSGEYYLRINMAASAQVKRIIVIK